MKFRSFTEYHLELNFFPSQLLTIYLSVNLADVYLCTFYREKGVTPI